MVAGVKIGATETEAATSPEGGPETEEKEDAATEVGGRNRPTPQGMIAVAGASAAARLGTLGQAGNDPGRRGKEGQRKEKEKTEQEEKKTSTEIKGKKTEEQERNNTTTQ